MAILRMRLGYDIESCFLFGLQESTQQYEIGSAGMSVTTVTSGGSSFVDPDEVDEIALALQITEIEPLMGGIDGETVRRIAAAMVAGIPVRGRQRRPATGMVRVGPCAGVKLSPHQTCVAIVVAGTSSVQIQAAIRAFGLDRLSPPANLFAIVVDIGQGGDYYRIRPIQAT